MREFTWTTENIAHLCRRYRDGAIHKIIAQELGCSKGASIGKFNRLIKEGHALALGAAAAQDPGTADRVAEWMASYGGTVPACARSLGLSNVAAKSAWIRVRNQLGSQAR